MSIGKVEKRNAQVKLVFGEVNESSFNLEGVIEELGLELHAFATSAGVLVMKTLMKAEEEYLAGKRQSHDTEVNRWGRQGGAVMLGGQKVKIERTRLRRRNGGEVSLQSYERFRNNDVRAQAVYERLISGISCRDYSFGHSSCATLDNGGYQKMEVAGSPSGAKVWIGDNDIGTTPLAVEVRRGSDHIVRVAQKEYEEAELTITNTMSGWVWGNLASLAWIIHKLACTDDSRVESLSSVYSGGQFT